MSEVEKRARALLAEEMQAHYPTTADWLRDEMRGEDHFPRPTQAAIRALVRALTPTDERVEAVARAMWESEIDPAYSPWEQADKKHREVWMDRARAAIAAMGGGRE